MRVPFNTVWDITEKGITNKVAIRVCGITAYPNALKDYQGFFGGIDWNLFKGRDLQVQTDPHEKDVLVITGIY